MCIEAKEPRIPEAILEENKVETLHYVTFSTLLSNNIKIRM